MLEQEGWIATRFVDDFRIFLRAHEDPYDVLAVLAEQLGISEGLSLNVSKTRVDDRLDFVTRLKHLVSDVSDEAENEAFDALTSDLYFDDEPDKLFFRKAKTGFGQLPPMEQACFVWGATCLPEDEFDAWLTTAKPLFSTPLGAQFLKWAQQQREKLIGKLGSPADEGHD